MFIRRTDGPTQCPSLQRNESHARYCQHLANNNISQFFRLFWTLKSGTHLISYNPLLLRFLRLRLHLHRRHPLLRQSPRPKGPDLSCPFNLPLDPRRRSSSTLAMGPNSDTLVRMWMLEEFKILFD